VKHPGAQERASKPKDCRNKAKGLGGLPLVTLSTVVQTSPVEYSTAINFMDPVDQDSESREPSGADDEVDGVVHKRGREG